MTQHDHTHKNKVASCSCDENLIKHADDDGHNHGHSHDEAGSNYSPAIISFIMLLSGLALEYVFKPDFFNGWVYK